MPQPGDRIMASDIKNGAIVGGAGLLGLFMVLAVLVTNCYSQKAKDWEVERALVIDCVKQGGEYVTSPWDSHGDSWRSGCYRVTIEPLGPAR